MSTVVLLHGNPGNGKTYLATLLATSHSFISLHLDSVCVSFIKDFCPELYFAALSLYVGLHYDSILVHRQYSKLHLGRDFVSEWHDHLRHQILMLASQHSRVVVEGYLLHDFKDGFVASASPPIRVFSIEVVDRTYRMNDDCMTIEQIAVLGS